jgi:hypothetical protein
MGLLIAEAKACHEGGYLCLDDVVVENVFANSGLQCG